jgi:hypothetical protein
VISQATNRLQSSPAGVKSIYFLLGLDSNVSHKKCQSLETGRTFISASYSRGSLQGVKRPEREVVHSPPSSDEFKMRGVIPLLPLYAFMAQTGTTLPFYLLPSAVYLNILCLINCSPPYPFTFHSSKLYCLICNIFTHAISNTGYERRINLRYETMNSTHRRKKQLLSILGTFPAFTWMDWVTAWRKSELLVSLSIFELETFGIQVRKANVWIAWSVCLALLNLFRCCDYLTKHNILHGAASFSRSSKIFS